MLHASFQQTTSRSEDFKDLGWLTQGGESMLNKDKLAAQNQLMEAMTKPGLVN